jgi:hypothetical protein
MRDAELKSLPKLSDTQEAIQTDPEIRAHLQDALWGELADLKHRLHPFSVTSNTTLYRAVHTEYDSTLSVTTNLVFAGLDIPPHRLIHRTQSYYSSNAAIPTDVLPEVTLPSHPLVDTLHQVVRLHAECKTRWDALEIRVIGFLDHCKSLNHALELWPEVVQFVPEFYVKKTKEKSRTRQESDKDRAAKEALAQVDMNAAAVSITCAQMAGHTKGGT